MTSQLTAPQIRMLRQVAETGETRGRKEPFDRLLQLRLVEHSSTTSSGRCVYKPTGLGRMWLNVILKGKGQ